MAKIIYAFHTKKYSLGDLRELFKDCEDMLVYEVRGDLMRVVRYRG